MGTGRIQKLGTRRRTARPAVAALPCSMLDVERWMFDVQHQIPSHTPAPWGDDPIGTVTKGCHLTVMNILLILVVLLLLFGGGGFYLGGPVFGGSALGLILVICLVVYFMGGFREIGRASCRERV